MTFKGQSKKRSFQEALANMILGLILSQIVLFLFGIPVQDAALINVIMIAISFIRSYFVRRFFNYLG